MGHLDYLVNRIGARTAGSEDLLYACEWAHDEFIDFGLANVHLERCPEVPESRLLTMLVRLVKSPEPLYNVVADIPGREWPDEYVVVGAHIDSDDAGDGATDNGTGVAAAMEAARILITEGARPRRTIRFILFTGEEKGKIGSRAYVARHAELMPRVSAMLNMDEGANYISGIYTTDAIAADFEEAFASVGSLDSDMPFRFERVDRLTDIITECCGSSGTSDHGPFFEAGVPAFQWLQKGRNSLPYYAHTRRDTYERAVPEYLEHSATVIALGALGLANLDHMVSRRDLRSKRTREGTCNPCIPSGQTERCASSRRNANVCCPDDAS
jgi:Zn-dependent M28 family amino/carboxypeptidase